MKWSANVCHVYEGDRLVCQCAHPEDATAIALAMNTGLARIEKCGVFKGEWCILPIGHTGEHSWE